MRRTIITLAALTAIPVAALAQAQMTHFATIPSTNMLSSNVVGLDIYDNADHDLGKVKDVAFDNSKAITGYIISVGGVLGMGAHYVAVDPDSIKIKYDDADKKWHANMNATVDQLKAAPEFKYDGEWNASKS